MRIRWTIPASDDLERIADYLREANPAIERAVILAILDGISNLNQFPYRARAGANPGTRELVISHYPYIVVYRIVSEFIEILNVWHAAQDWPLFRQSH